MRKYILDYIIMLLELELCEYTNYGSMTENVEKNSTCADSEDSFNQYVSV